MATLLVNLPIVSGGIGGSVATAQLAGAKTIIGTGVTGTVTIEASVDGGTSWCPVATLTNTKTDTIVDVACSDMRLNATGGDAATMCVQAEGSQTRTGVIPNPPANGPGASLDISLFGPFSTVGVSGLTAGQVGFQISCDDVNWSDDFKNFTADGCFTKNISARFVRAVGTGATVGAIGITSEESGDGAALTEPRTCFVFSKTQAPNGNIYDNFEQCTAAANSVAPNHGSATICFDVPSAFGSILVEAATTLPNLTYDVVNLIFNCDQALGTVDFAAGVRWNGMPEFRASRLTNWRFNCATGNPVIDTERAGFFDNVKSRLGIFNVGAHILRNATAKPWLRVHTGGGSFPTDFVTCLSRAARFQIRDTNHVVLAGTGRFRVEAQGGRQEIGADIVTSEGPGEGVWEPQAMGPAGGIDWQPENQSGFSGEFRIDDDFFAGMRAFPNPINGTDITADTTAEYFKLHRLNNGEGPAITLTLPNVSGRCGDTICGYNYGPGSVTLDPAANGATLVGSATVITGTPFLIIVSKGDNGSPSAGKEWTRLI